MEIDELHHNTAQSEKDDPEREACIIKKMACEFLRFKIDDPESIHADAVKKIKVRIKFGAKDLSGQVLQFHAFVDKRPTATITRDCLDKANDQLLSNRIFSTKG